jgi:predicted permease
MSSLLADLRYAARMLARRPALSLIAVATIALGIGASTAIFSVVDAVLLRALPYRDADRLVMVWEAQLARGRLQNQINLANYEDWKAQSRTLGEFAAFFDTTAALGGDGEPEQVPSQIATPELFRVLGAAPLLGRTFAPDDGMEGQPRAVVLSFGLWQRRFGGDLSIVGHRFIMNGRDAVVVGVMPEGFAWHVKQGSMTRQSAQLWSAWQVEDELKQRRGRFAMAVARVAPGSTVEEATAEMRAIGQRLAREHPDFNAKWGVNVVPVRTQLSGELRPSLLVLMGAVGFLLLIACANVSNLLLARASARHNEMAVRVALGARRRRIIRQLLTESVLLAGLGGLAGLGLAVWGIDALTGLAPPELGDLPDIGVSLPVLAFAVSMSLATGVGFGLAPALVATRVDLHQSLKEGARDSGGARRRRLRGALVIVETALALMLLVGAGLMMKSFLKLAEVDPGFDPGGVLTMKVSLPAARYDSDEKLLVTMKRVSDELAALPGVDVVGAVSYLPFAGPPAGTGLEVVGRPPLPAGSRLVTQVNIVDAGFFRALRIPLVRGRLFSPDEERAMRHVVVVNQAFVRSAFPDEDPLGKRVIILMKDENVPSTIIGVVADSAHAALDRPIEPMAYWPHPELAVSALTFVLKTSRDPAAVAGAARRAVYAIDPAQPVADVQTLDTLLSRSIARARFTTVLLAVFAAVALLLAAVGIGGVMAISVEQRTREIGIRIAIGAPPPSVVGLVVRQGMALALAGLAIGICGALAFGRFLDKLLFGVAPTDPATFAIIAAALATTALIACLIPARRAAGVDPIVALRNE